MTETSTETIPNLTKVTSPPVSPDINLLPGFIRGPQILVPLKIDISYQGARLVDTLCWNIGKNGEAMEVEEFVARTCADLNLPIGYQYRMCMQMVEQIEAYTELVKHTIQMHTHIPQWKEKVEKPQTITIGIRYNNVDYADKVDWAPLTNYYTPEDFARTTVADLGLPLEMEPAIAHKIRESLFRWLIGVLQNPSGTPEEVSLTPEFKIENAANTTSASSSTSAPPQVPRLTPVPTHHVVDMVGSLWKRARPQSLEDVSSVPQPLLPPGIAATNTLGVSNAYTYTSKYKEMLK
eukprot:gene27757-33525_t